MRANTGPGDSQLAVGMPRAEIAANTNDILSIDLNTAEEAREACERDHQFKSANQHGLERVGFWTVERSPGHELVEASVAGVQHRDPQF